MRYTVVSTSEWTYPDRFEYATGSRSIRLDSARGGLTGVQVLLKDVESCPALSFELPGAQADFFEMLPIPVDQNVNLLPPSNDNGGASGEHRPFEDPHCPERVAPFFVYDCLKPFEPDCPQREGTIGLYVRVQAPGEPGTYTGILSVGGEKIPVELQVYAASVPAETFQNVYWYSREKIAELHGLEFGSPEFDAMEEKYLRLMRYMRQTVLAVSHPKTVKTGENKYSFDFTETERELERGMRLGFQYFSLMPVAGRKSWKLPDLYVYNDFNAMSYEGYCWLRQFLTALRAFLDSKGLLGKMRMGVADEPTAANEVSYRALAGLIRRYCPELILTEALSYCNIHGAINTYVPLNAEYQRHRAEFESFREAGDEIWQYVCCAPRGDGFINRFLDYPLLSTRYQYWGNYFFDLTGYLHWAFFQPQPGQDLFTVSCPEHHNADSVGFLPAGDTHLCYNGDDGPWMSIRLEALRQSAEEYEWLRLLDSRDPEKACAICTKVFRSFNDVEYDPNRFDETRRELLSAAE